MIYKYKIYYLSGGNLRSIKRFIDLLTKDGYEVVKKNDEEWYKIVNEKYIVEIKDDKNNLYNIEFNENYPFKPIKINNIYEIQEDNWQNSISDHVKIINNVKSLYELIKNLNDVDIKAVIGAKYKDYERINNKMTSSLFTSDEINPVTSSWADTMDEPVLPNNEKFNLFFDIENENKYYQDEDLYTINMDFNDDEKYKFLSVLNNKFSLIAFDYSTVKFLNKLENIKYLLDFLKYDGKLYLPIRNTGGGSFVAHFVDGNLLDYYKNTDIRKYNEYNNEMTNFKEKYGEFTFNDDETFTLIDSDKIDIIINSDEIDLIPYTIIYNAKIYYPDAEQIKNIFIKKIEKIFNNNNNNYKIEIILNEDYPFEPSNENYIEEHIVIKKIN